MKKLVIISLIFCCFLNCKETKESNYEKQFKKHFVKTLHDPNSFELVKLNILEGRYSHKENISFIKENKLYEFEDSIRGSIIDSLIRNQEEVIIEYRAKNKFGAKVLDFTTAYFVNGNIKYIDNKRVY